MMMVMMMMMMMMMMSIIIIIILVVVVVIIIIIILVVVVVAKRRSHQQHHHHNHHRRRRQTPHHQQHHHQQQQQQHLRQQHKQQHHSLVYVIQTSNFNRYDPLKSIYRFDISLIHLCFVITWTFHGGLLQCNGLTRHLITNVIASKMFVICAYWLQLYTDQWIHRWQFPLKTKTISSMFLVIIHDLLLFLSHLCLHKMDGTLHTIHTNTQS